jgi:hypothetical protein
MDNHKKLGIWMDQSKAILIGYYDDKPLVFEEMESPVEIRPREKGEGNSKTRFIDSKGGPSNNENKMHNTQENQLKLYFSDLEKRLIGSEELLLFGPGIVKNQFLKSIQSNKKLDILKVQIEDTDKMTQNQLLARVRQYFKE